MMITLYYYQPFLAKPAFIGGKNSPKGLNPVYTLPQEIRAFGKTFEVSSQRKLGSTNCTAMVDSSFRWNDTSALGILSFSIAKKQIISHAEVAHGC